MAVRVVVAVAVREEVLLGVLLSDVVLLGVSVPVHETLTLPTTDADERCVPAIEYRGVRENCDVDDRDRTGEGVVDTRPVKDNVGDTVVDGD